jgi:hypothetical protein
MKSKKLPQKHISDFVSMHGDDARHKAAKGNRQKRTGKPSIYDEFYDEFDDYSDNDAEYSNGYDDEDDDY